MDAPFSRQTFNQPLTYRALKTLALAIGWQEDKTQGKGSHRAFTRNGYRMVTLPCHGEAHDYSRGLTRKFLKQILEPLNDVCSASVDGIYQVEQVERIIAERLEYLPAQMQGEYDRAIAEMKATVDQYRNDQKLQVDRELDAYEAQRLSECERTIEELQQERAKSSASDLSVMLAGCLIQQRQQYHSLNDRHRGVCDNLADQQQILKNSQAQQQALQKQLVASQQQEKSLREEFRQDEQRQQAQIQSLQRLRKRDRLIIWGLLAVSVCLGVVLVNQTLDERRSPQTSHLLRANEFNLDT